ncbi:retrovirus-related pol polyprotein from transposon TNT 1-94 [Tanacetum coccineum]
MDKNAFLKLVEEKFRSADKALAGTLMAKLTTIKFDGSKSMQQHVLDMTNTATRLKTLGMNVDDSFLVQFIMNSLPLEYGPFHINFNLVNQGVDKKLKPKAKNFKKKQHATTLKVSNGKKKEQHNNKCNFCRKEGHFQKDCPKRKTWSEKKDDFSRYGYVYLLHEKSQSINALAVFLNEVERQQDKKVKIVRSDRGDEYYGKYDESGQCLGPFAKFFESRGICAQYNMPRTPQQNGVAERRNRTLMEMIKSMISNAKFLENGKVNGSVENQIVDINVVRDTDLSPMNAHKSITTPDVVPSAIPDDYIVYLQETDFDIGIDNDPVSFSQAIESDKCKMWIAAIKEKFKSMDQNKVWDLVNFPEGSKRVGCKWVFKTKRNSNGNVERYKARLVAKTYTQKNDVDYNENFSPVSKKDSLRIILALMAHFDLELDVKNAFLNGNLEEEVYMEQPEGFFIDGKEKMISGSKYIFLVLYVDDILLATNDFGLLHKTKEYLFKNFEMKDMGEASYVTGISILCDVSKGLEVVDTISKPLKIYYDNTATIFFSKNDKYSNGAKHIDIKFFIVKEEIQKQRLYLKHISTDLMIADPLTKGLPPTAFT